SLLVALWVGGGPGAAVFIGVGWIRPARAAAAAKARAGTDLAVADPAASSPAGTPPANPAGRRRAMIAILAALAVTAIMQCLFATTYMSAQHAPKAANLPFRTTGSSPALTAAQKTT